MNTLRWADEVRGVEYLELKDEALDPDRRARTGHGQASGGRHDREVEAGAVQGHLPGPDHGPVEKKAREGKLEAVGGPEEAVDRRSADVIDLTELLKRSRLPSRAGARRRGGRGRRCAGKGASQIQACEQGQDQQVVQLVTHTQGTGREQQIQQEGQLGMAAQKGTARPLVGGVGISSHQRVIDEASGTTKLALAEYYRR